MVPFELTEQEKELLVRAEKIDSLLVEVRELVSDTDKFAKEHKIKFIYSYYAGCSSDELEDAKSRIISSVRYLVDQLGWNSSSIGCY